MKTSTKTILSILAIVVAIIIVGIFVNTGILNPKSVQVPTTGLEAPVSQTLSVVSQFAWRYESGADDLDGLPKTLIFLDTTYDNGNVISQKIEEVQGSCNNVDPSRDDTDIAERSTKIQCYAAGFGEYYKITKGTDSYQVMRKHIEEGNPEVAPVDFKYEKVAEVPFSA